MAEQGTPKVHPSTKAMSKLAKTVRTNFFRTLEINQMLTTTREMLNQETISMKPILHLLTN